MSFFRLNKYLASQGVASRRQIDQFTSQRRILINNKIAVLGDKVDPETDTIQIDKKIISPTPSSKVYYAINKPKFVLSSSSDNRGRKTVLDYVPKTPRVFAVGRLDYESTGLLFLTNDGDFSFRLTHPRFHFPKTYLVTTIGRITPEKISQLKNGVQLDDGKTAPADVQVLPAKFNQGQLEITLYQGKKRQIRRMCSALHLHVVDLHRCSISSVNLGNLPPGEYRNLTPEEVNNFLR